MAVAQRRIGAVRLGGIRCPTINFFDLLAAASPLEGSATAHNAASACGAAPCSVPLARRTGSRRQRDTGDACARELDEIAFSVRAAPEEMLLGPQRLWTLEGMMLQRRPGQCAAVMSKERSGEPIEAVALWATASVRDRAFLYWGGHARRTGLRPSSVRAQSLRLSSRRGPSERALVFRERVGDSTAVLLKIPHSDYSRSLKNPALQQFQKCSKSASVGS